jgi:hypothetical protein
MERNIFMNVVATVLGLRALLSVTRKACVLGLARATEIAMFASLP